MIKLIASDIDGTLINSDHHVSAYTKEIVHKAQAQGIEFVIATGRNHASAEGVAKELDVDCAIISLNGMRVENPANGYKVLEASMTFDQCRHMEEIGKEFYMGILYCFEDKVYFQMDDRSLEDYQFGMSDARLNFFNDELKTEQIRSLDDIRYRFEADDNHISKMVFVQNDDYTELVKERIARAFDDKFNLLIVGAGWAEIMPRHVNKGDALVRYGASRGIKPEEMISFGDSDNDLTLLKRVGCGVAMKNARETLKMIADEVTDTNDNDGVARYIAKHILNEDVA